MQVTKLAPGVSVVMGDGGNIAVVPSRDTLLIVDAGLPDNAGALVKAIAEQVSPLPIRTVFNTHWHFDHTGANVMLGTAGARIVSHENTRARLSSKITMEALNRTFEPIDPAGLPTITFSDAGSLYQGTVKLAYTHVAPAHTDTDAFVVFPAENIIHTGDLYFNGFYPVIDYSTGGWIGGMVAAADKILAVADNTTKIIPGHGPMSDKATLKATRDMLASITDKLTGMSKKKMSVEQVIAAAPTKEFDAKWGNGMMKPEVFTRVAYTSIQRNGTK